MLTLCLSMDLKPGNGRRKDLKNVEAVVEEIHAMIQKW